MGVRLVQDARRSHGGRRVDGRVRQGFDLGGRLSSGEFVSELAAAEVMIDISGELARVLDWPS